MSKKFTKHPLRAAWAGDTEVHVGPCPQGKETPKRLRENVLKPHTEFHKDAMAVLPPHSPTSPPRPSHDRPWKKTVNFSRRPESHKPHENLPRLRVPPKELNSRSPKTLITSCSPGHCAKDTRGKREAMLRDTHCCSTRNRTDPWAPNQNLRGCSLETCPKPPGPSQDLWVWTTPNDHRAPGLTYHAAGSYSAQTRMNSSKW